MVSSDEMAIVLVFIFFLAVSILIIKSGKTKLKSRYAYMFLSLVFSLIILIHLIQAKREESSDVSHWIPRVPLVVDSNVAGGKIMETRNLTTEESQGPSPVRQKRKIISPKVKKVNANRTKLRPTRRVKDRTDDVRRNLFLELYKARKHVAGYLTKENKTKLLPAVPYKEAKDKYKDYLPWWELDEMYFYPYVWYIGLNTSKVQYEPDENNMNFGFDEWQNEEAQEENDERMFKIAIGDHLQYRYQIVRILGHGSYGRVVLARDHALPITDEYYNVAVKIMHNESHAIRYFRRELDMQRYIETNTAVPELYTKILRTFFFRNHFCIVFELLGTSLFRKLEEPIVDLDVLRKYMLDILVPVKNLHKINIVHGDLKPENLMMIRGCNESCSPMVKLADFNLACTPGIKKFTCPGVYFQTRHYRAPEVILDLNYTIQADMWSVGVMAAEFYLGQLPFYGETAIDQLAAIMEVFGLIPPEMVKVSPRMQVYQKAVNYKCKNGFKRKPYRKPLQRILRNTPPILYDFIKNCLVLDPDERMTSFQALEHPFMKDYMV